MPIIAINSSVINKLLLFFENYYLVIISETSIICFYLFRIPRFYRQYFIIHVY